ncbi:MAG: hypothetical protein U9R38_00135 [Candidatus Margulisiibacteriota bacterium]|nr:hypothetical protein [Candidatus Margulisiibacteriota bacterium]
MLIVHATKGYDRKASVARPIQEAIESRPPSTNVLEVVDKLKGSYLSLPEGLTTSREYAGCLLDRNLLEERADLFATNTFVFMGGRANKCLLRAVLSVLIAKLTPLERLFAKKPSHPHMDGLLEELSVRPQTGNPQELNFHFNCEAIYPSQISLKWFSENPEVLDWSPNMPWVVMTSIQTMHQKVFEKLNINTDVYIDGNKQGGRSSANSRSNTKINLYYWSSAFQMTAALRVESE